ncbi:MAG: MFS transporter [Mogibacterium sp.]|nr:MFS transporter [Mogibacterium sp.]
MKERTKHLLGIYCISSLMTLAVMIVSPTIELTARDFPDASSMAIQYITVLPTLLAIPAALLTSAIAKKIGARTVGMISLALYAITALGVIFSHSITAILFWRAVNGIAVGFTACGLFFQSALFKPEERRAIAGYTSFGSNALGILFAVTSGMISSIFGWRASYWIYVVLCVPAVFIIRATLPGKAEMEERVAAQQAQLGPQDGPKPKAKFNWGFWWSVFLIMLCFICTGILSSNVAMHMVQRGLGTSATIGIAMMVNNAAACVIGFFYGKITRKTARWNFTIGPIIMGCGLIIAANATSTGMMMAAQFISGIGWGYILAEARILIFGTTEPANRGIGLSMMSTAMNLGQAISPIIATPLAALIFGELPSDRFMLAACIMILVGVLYAFIDPKKAVKFKEV